MAKHFLGRRIVVFTAHPDDEGIAGGTMFENYKAGGETFLICATYGEKGKSHLTKPVSDAALKEIRKEELLNAAKILHVNEVLFLGLPDAKVKECEEKLYQKSLPLIQKIAPDYIISFGPDGISAHWDHITAGVVAEKIAKKLDIPFIAFTLSTKIILSMGVSKYFFLARRKFGVYNGLPKHRRGNIKIKIDLGVKRRAMRSHISQFGSAGLLSQGLRNVMNNMPAYEYFVKEVDTI